MLYIGVTSELYFRIREPKQKYYPNSFFAKYNCNLLVFFEQFSSIEEVIIKEKQFKNWKRNWKINLINEIILIGMIYFLLWTNHKRVKTAINIEINSA
ncbi:GIY-YIG nuclease family protein [Pedobacter sp. Leaf176]|uniref:GIY-YIG nuclease family protein n=1 Tax=Pedobacter sp. Leaf176 TaxID=1736286 RepID=UPI000AB61FBC|nr:GIY-YIG nuclease family protein [Pedobacter sp. Leaf176]